MASTSLRIHVNAVSSAEANRLAGELEQWLRSCVEDLDLARARENLASQDAGTILVAALSAPAAIALAKGPALELAKGIADWLRKRRASVAIGANGSIKVENVTADNAEEIVLQILRAQAKAASTRP